MRAKLLMAACVGTMLLSASGCGQEPQPTASEAPPSASDTMAPAATDTGLPAAGTSENVAKPTAADLKSKVTAAFSADPKIAAYQLTVEPDPENYLVALKGKVPSDAEKYRIEQVAVDAIKDPTMAIDNQLVAPE